MDVPQKLHMTKSLCSQDLWASILILKHKWRALSGREDCPCEDFRRATEEDLAVRERVPSRTERPSFREPGTNGNHAPIGQAQNEGSIANGQ